MNALDHLRAALDELDSETSELQARLEELRVQRGLVAVAIDGYPATPGTPAIAKPSATTRTSAPRRQRGHDYSEVARVACAAIAAGNSGAEAVAAHLGCSPSGAKQAIQKARKLGHAIPRDNRSAPRTADELPAPEERPAAPWTPKPGEMVLACREDGCDAVYPSYRATQLNRHCLAAHRRTASGEERIPVKWKVAA